MVISQLKRIAYKHLLIQLIATFSLSVATLLFGSSIDALSVACGGLACVIPSGYFCYRFSRNTGAQNAKKILKDFYRGEIIKLLLTGLIFLLIFKFIPVTIFAVFIGFITAQAAFWVSLLILRSERAVT